MHEPQPYYHAIACAARGEYRLIGRLLKNSEDGTWKSAYERMDASLRNAFHPEDSYAALLRQNISIILKEDKAFPDPLRHIPHPPFGIYIKGTIDSIQNAPFGIALIGTRRASQEGIRMARHFASTLSYAGCAVISGLAFGIDIAAHQGALEARGKTVAILAGGLDLIYPRSHERYAQEILAAGGCIISEYPPGEHPLGRRFIERNRMVSGLARGVLIIEAPARSGTLATARFAVEQNRELFVVPGSIDSFRYEGSHALIRGGAELVTCPEDILEAYGMRGIQHLEKTVLRKAESAEEVAILGAFINASGTLDVDKIINTTKLEPRIVIQTLEILIVRNAIREIPGGYMLNG